MSKVEVSGNSKMLVVDDSPLFRVRIANFLRSHYTFDIEELNSAQELINYLEHTQPEEILLIILDLYLPDGSGLDAISKIRKKSNYPNLPFILVSARVDRETVARAFREGAKDVITKPVNHEKLKERLDNIIAPEYIVKDKKTIMDYYSQIMNETKRAQRGNYNLSIVLAGIFQKSDLKSIYKEGFYRQVIDLEQRYPKELQKKMRETDTITSLSPSEYLFVLPFTHKNGTEVIREKILQVFNELVSEKDRESMLMIIGAATFPDDGESTDDLIAKLEENFKQQFFQQKSNDPSSNEPNQEKDNQSTGQTGE